MRKGGNECESTICNGRGCSENSWNQSKQGLSDTSKPEPRAESERIHYNFREMPRVIF